MQLPQAMNHHAAKLHGDAIATVRLLVLRWGGVLDLNGVYIIPRGLGTHHGEGITFRCIRVYVRDG
jgi:hypothetical protein